MDFSSLSKVCVSGTSETLEADPESFNCGATDLTGSAHEPLIQTEIQEI